MARIILVQISDLHIGSGIQGDIVATKGPHTGLNGHALLLCEHLQVAIDQTVAADFSHDDVKEPRPVVCVGDLSRIGSENDFFLAYTYLWEQWRLPGRVRSRNVGLRIPRSDLHAVAGNHDHWDGYKGVIGLHPPPYNANIYPQFMKRDPWREVIWAPKGADAANAAFALELFGIDSNRGKGLQSSNLFAGGVFWPKDLIDLESLLMDSVTDAGVDKIPRLRAILCHHHLKGPPNSPGPLAMASAAQLLSLAHRYEVAGILTGHTHGFLDDPNVDPATNHTTWELRSASATAIDPQPEPQGFFVHEMERASGTFGPATWKAWRYQLDAAKTAFVRKTNPTAVR